MTRVLLPAALFLVSALLSVMSLHAAAASAILGLCLCAYSFARSRRSAAAYVSSAQTGPSASRTMLAGLALLVAPVATVLVVVAAMAGWFGRG
jgi:hypothetical protein